MSTERAEVRIAARISNSEKEWLDSFCKKHHCTISWAVREALRQIMKEKIKVEE